MPSFFKSGLRLSVRSSSLVSSKKKVQQQRGFFQRACQEWFSPTKELYLWLFFSISQYLERAGLQGNEDLER